MKIKQGSDALAPLERSSTALLATFRKNGAPVRTVVGIRVMDDKAYFTTCHTTGKVKRLARNPQVLLAPSTRLGATTGPTLNSGAADADAPIGNDSELIY